MVAVGVGGSGVLVGVEMDGSDVVVVVGGSIVTVDVGGSGVVVAVGSSMVAVGVGGSGVVVGVKVGGSSVVVGVGEIIQISESTQSGGAPLGGTPRAPSNNTPFHALRLSSVRSVPTPSGSRPSTRSRCLRESGAWPAGFQARFGLHPRN